MRGRRPNNRPNSRQAVDGPITTSKSGGQTKRNSGVAAWGWGGVGAVRQTCLLTPSLLSRKSLKPNPGDAPCRRSRGEPLSRARRSGYFTRSPRIVGRRTALPQRQAETGMPPTDSQAQLGAPHGLRSLGLLPTSDGPSFAGS